MGSFSSRTLTTFVLFLVATGLVACNQASSGGSKLAGTSWMLATVEGAPVPSGLGASLDFTAIQASGFGGCNQFSGSYSSDGSSTLSFGPMASTRMACDPATDLFESTYLAALGKVAHYTMTADGLSLSTSDNVTVLTFGTTPAATVEGPWNVVMVNNGQGAVSSVPTGISSSMSFGADGTVQGFGGCNNFNGGYTVKDDTIAIGPLMATKKSCGTSTDQFEAQLLAALQASTRWSVTGGTLDLRNADGAQQVQATSAIGR